MAQSGKEDENGDQPGRNDIELLTEHFGYPPVVRLPRRNSYRELTITRSPSSTTSSTR